MKRALIFLIVAAPLLLAGCARGPRQVVIGIALTQSNHPAVELAAREINAMGGVRGVPVVLAGLDWKVDADFDAGDVIAWAKRFSENRDLVAVIGHSDSSSTLSAAAFYNQHAIPQIVTIATNPAITNIGDWTYRLCPSDSLQGDILARYAVEQWGKRRIAIFAANDAYGGGLLEAFSKAVQAGGAKIVLARMHRDTLQPDDMTMIRQSLLQLKQAGGADLFVLLQRIPAATWTIGQIREAGFQSDILGGDSLSPPTFARAFKVTEGVRVSEFFHPSPDDAAAQHLIAAMRAAGITATDYGQVFAYDSVYLVCQALESEGFGRVDVKRYLDRLIERQTPVSGAGGSYRFGPDHDARRAIYLSEVRNGAFQIVKTIPGED